MTDPIKCPFCGAKRHKAPFRTDQFRCGTQGPLPDGEYATSTWCDKEFFRNAFLRCREIIDELASLDYKLNVPIALLEKIVEESKR